ncbi:polysaccharide deacetylase family protein [Micromonospora sp. NPDC000089]|uniref:polysaccharide deacetylase family protein n=1 Tax=unclassified Micromonospora TaxID=2617518 RepID=UPI0036A41225
MLTLCLHDITESPAGEFDIRPDELSGIVEAVAAHGLPMLSPSHVTEAARSELDPPGVCLIFDDGYRSTLEHAGPLMARYDWAFGLAAVPGHLISGDPSYLTPQDVGTWLALGGELLGHTYSHADLPALAEPASVDDELDRELRFYAAERLPRPAAFCYPYGRSSPAVEEQVGRRYGAAFRTGDGDGRALNIRRLTYRRSRFAGVDPASIVSHDFTDRTDKRGG